MRTPSFAVLSRRASLLSLGMTWLSVIAGPTFVDAKRKNKGNRKKEDPNKLCKRQAQEWGDYVVVECGDNPDCLEYLTCVDPLRTCNFAAWFDCYLAVSGFQIPSRRVAAFFAGRAAAKKHRVSRKALKKCQSQVQQCVNAISPFCQGDANCLTEYESCCDLTGTCNLLGLSACIGSL